MNILTGHACSTNGYYKTNKQQQQVIIQIYQNKYNSMHDDQVLQKNHRTVCSSIYLDLYQVLQIAISMHI
jgi:hypothetical protein